jgi:hypothetical protein
MRVRSPFQRHWWLLLTELHDGMWSDSAGQPWAGRTLSGNAFALDDGSAPEQLMDTLRRFHRAGLGACEVIDVLRSSRLLIPLVARAGQSETRDDGRIIDVSQELSIVTVAGPDGRDVLPVFSSVAAMRLWNMRARPVPADGVRVAVAAAAEGTDLVVLDPSSSTEFVIRRPALWAMARSLPWRPSYEVMEVVEAFSLSVESELAIVGVELCAGDPRSRLDGPELVVRLQLIAGLTGSDLDAVVARLTQQWAENEVIATYVDSLRVQLVPHG